MFVGVGSVALVASLLPQTSLSACHRGGVMNPSVSRQKAETEVLHICRLAGLVVQTPDTGSFEMCRGRHDTKSRQITLK